MPSRVPQVLKYCFLLIIPTVYTYILTYTFRLYVIAEDDRIKHDEKVIKSMLENDKKVNPA